MPRINIDSVDDPHIEPYRDMPRSSLSRESGLFIAEGRLLVERLLASDFQVHSVLVDQRYAEATSSLVPLNVPLFVASQRVIEKIVGFNFHRGMMACGRRKPSRQLVDVLPSGKDSNGRPLTILVAAGIGDPENLGAVLRNCMALGVDVALLGDGCADPFSRRVLRVSVGTVLKLPVVESADLAADLTSLREKWKVQLAATVLDETAESLNTAERPSWFALLLGSESDGLRDCWIELCDRRITLPMSRGTDSLNVAVASGIFLYHFMR